MSDRKKNSEVGERYFSQRLHKHGYSISSYQSHSCSSTSPWCSKLQVRWNSLYHWWNLQSPQRSRSHCRSIWFNFLENQHKISMRFWTPKWPQIRCSACIRLRSITCTRGRTMRIMSGRTKNNTNDDLSWNLLSEMKTLTKKLWK